MDILNHYIQIEQMKCFSNENLKMHMYNIIHLVKYCRYVLLTSVLHFLLLRYTYTRFATKIFAILIYRLKY